MDLTFNKNFYNYLGNILFSGFSNGPMQIGTSYLYSDGYTSGYTFQCDVTDTDGNSYAGIWYQVITSKAGSGYNHSLAVFNKTEDNYFRNIRFVCGSGNTAATVNDTALATANTNITATIDSGKRDTANSFIYTVTFTAATEQTLREIGLVRNLVVTPSGSTAASAHEILFARGVFETPITLDENTTKTVQIRLALPTLA
jgi:hypothetical protein